MTEQQKQKSEEIVDLILIKIEIEVNAGRSIPDSWIDYMRIHFNYQDE